jgi:hypothetical protein
MEKAAKKCRTDDDCHVVISKDGSTSNDDKNKNSSILTLLDDNSLLQVLLRTHCEDHSALRNTCRRFCGIVDSHLFRQQRAQQEWAQVEVRVLTARELYKKWTSDNDEDDDDDENPDDDSYFHDNYNELGYIPAEGAVQNEFGIFVDGKPAGNGKFTLLQRNKNSHVNFHATCDAISQDLQATGCLFFDSRGRPRLASVKEAMKMTLVDGGGGKTPTISNRQQKDYFMYLESFQLNPEHRGDNGSTTWIGAQAIRSLLLDSPLLQDKWSVVIYMGDARANFTDDDEKRSMDQQEDFLAMVSGDHDDLDQTELQQQEADWKERLHNLAKDDLRPFLRSGFQQAVDSVNHSDCFYIFAVPAFLRSGRPMLSHKEALAVKIVDKKDLSSSTSSSSSSVEIMSGKDSKLLSFMMRSCAKRSVLCETIRRKQAVSPPTREQFAECFDSEMAGMGALLEEVDAYEKIVEEQRRKNDEAMEQIVQARAEIEERKRLVSKCSTIVERLDDAERIVYQGWMVQLQQNEASLESESTLLKDKVSRTEECLQKIAETRESADSLLSKREATIEEAGQEAVSARDEAIATARTAVTQHDAEVKAEVDNMIRDGASIQNSNAIHACAANMTPEYIDLLLEFVPDDVNERRSVLNNPDSAGLTPLMAAAATATSSSAVSIASNARFQMAEKLIDLGADKNITDASGETALGKYRRMKRSMTDFRNMFGLQQHHHHRADTDSDHREHSRLGQLLRPFGGPTAADTAYLDDDDSSNDNDDDDDGDGSELGSDGDDEDQMDDEEEEAE